MLQESKRDLSAQAMGVENDLSSASIDDGGGPKLTKRTSRS
jgi:hypothetical protein